MGKDFDCEVEINRILEEAKEESIKQSIRVFNEAYLLGRRHAEAIFKEREANEQN